MTPAELTEAMEAEADALALAARHHDETPVPTCPGWTVQELVTHLGRIHRWARAAVEGAGDAPDGFPPRPEEVTEAWFRGGAAELATSLRETPPDTPAWTFTGPGTVRFWARRQAIETAVHRWDVQAAAGEPTPIDAPLAVIGVDEILDVLLPRRLATGEGSVPDASLHIHATDDQHGEWIVRNDDGALLVGHGHEKCDVAVRGTASDLLLWVWGRHPLGDLEVFGDPEAAAEWSTLLADA